MFRKGQRVMLVWYTIAPLPVILWGIPTVVGALDAAFRGAGVLFACFSALALATDNCCRLACRMVLCSACAGTCVLSLAWRAGPWAYLVVLAIASYFQWFIVDFLLDGQSRAVHTFATTVCGFVAYCVRELDAVSRVALGDASMRRLSSGNVTDRTSTGTPDANKEMAEWGVAFLFVLCLGGVFYLVIGTINGDCPIWMRSLRRLWRRHCPRVRVHKLLRSLRRLWRRHCPRVRVRNLLCSLRRLRCRCCRRVRVHTFDEDNVVAVVPASERKDNFGSAAARSADAPQFAEERRKRFFNTSFCGLRHIAAALRSSDAQLSTILSANFDRGRLIQWIVTKMEGGWNEMRRMPASVLRRIAVSLGLPKLVARGAYDSIDPQRYLMRKILGLQNPRCGCNAVEGASCACTHPVAKQAEILTMTRRSQLPAFQCDPDDAAELPLTVAIEGHESHEQASWESVHTTSTDVHASVIGNPLLWTPSPARDQHDGAGTC